MDWSQWPLLFHLLTLNLHVLCCKQTVYHPWACQVLFLLSVPSAWNSPSSNPSNSLTSFNSLPKHHLHSFLYLNSKKTMNNLNPPYPNLLLLYLSCFDTLYWILRSHIQIPPQDSFPKLLELGLSVSSLPEIVLRWREYSSSQEAAHFLRLVMNWGRT